ncbi:Uncharacterised protein [Burkholderia pseudomallei]|nr:Uncharacterised protein [Burkholderia pseudomallei]VCH18874.1 Uncharacterised protein [Burkholderia pseudomallei]
MWYLGMFLLIWLVPCIVVLVEIGYWIGINLIVPFVLKALGTFLPMVAVFGGANFYNRQIKE